MWHTFFGGISSAKYYLSIEYFMEKNFFLYYSSESTIIAPMKKAAKGRYDI